MKNTFLIFLLFIAVQSDLLFSQSIQSNNFFEGVRVLKVREGNRDLIYSSINGSPYYSKDFVESNVILSDTSIVQVSLRYDMFQDEMEYMQNNSTFWLSKTNIKMIKFGYEKMIVAPLPEEKSKLVYFFVQNTGRFQLLLRKSVKYYPMVSPKGYSDPVPERFERVEDETYLKIDEQSPHFFKSKKELLYILGNKPEIKDFISKEKIRIDNIPSLMKLIDYLNNSQH